MSYVSQIITLRPGDLILTGTTSGVGRVMSPPTFLRPGSVVRTSLAGVGELVNGCVADASHGLEA